MAMAAELSGLEAAELGRLRSLIEAAGLPAGPPAVGAQAMLGAMGMDKKVVQKQLRFVLLSELGEAISHELTTMKSRLQQILEDCRLMSGACSVCGQ